MTANANKLLIHLFSLENGREKRFLLPAGDVENWLNRMIMN